MRIGNIVIEHHKHNWIKVILSEYVSEHGTHRLEIAEKCSDPQCKSGYYRSRFTISCKVKPEAYFVD